MYFFFAGEEKGRSAGQVFPRVLFWLPSYEVRDQAAQVSQVQRRLRGQRLPQTLSELVLS